MNEHFARGNQFSFDFDIDPFRKHCLLNGLDDIGLTLKQADEIRAFEEKHQRVQPWLFRQNAPTDQV